MLVALGQVDSIEVATTFTAACSLVMDEGEGRPWRPQAAIKTRWATPVGRKTSTFRLLDCGLCHPAQPPAAARAWCPTRWATTALYVHLDDKFSYQAWWDNFRAGRVFVTNGPLLCA